MVLIPKKKQHSFCEVHVLQGNCHHLPGAGAEKKHLLKLYSRFVIYERWLPRERYWAGNRLFEDSECAACHHEILAVRRVAAMDASNQDQANHRKTTEGARAAEYVVCPTSTNVLHEKRRSRPSFHHQCHRIATGQPWPPTGGLISFPPPPTIQTARIAIRK